jgi:L-asparaginase
MSIRILITGGTIDNLEYDSEDKAPKDQQSLIPELLKKSRISLDYDIEEVIFKDSKFVNDNDKELIYQKCNNCKEDKIIITHGTMTMSKTARYIGQKKLEKTIILLGAAIPANKENSDALFNLGLAFSAVQLLPKGVYITMNGKIFSWDDVKKNLDTGFFEKEK